MHRWIGDAVVDGEVVRRSRRSARFQIVRARAHHATNFSSLHRDQAAVGKFANPKGNVDLLFPEIDRAILQTKLDIDIREFRQKLHNDWLQMQAAHCNGCRHDQITSRRRVLTRGRALGLGYICEDALGGGDVGTPRVGWQEHAARSVEQFGLQVRFELGHLSAHGRKWRPLMARRRRQAAGLGYRQNDRHGLETIHLTFPYFGRIYLYFARYPAVLKGSISDAPPQKRSTPR